MSTARQRPRHKHDWEVDGVTYFPRARSLSILWVCGTRGCGETRTEQARPRKPAATALTDLERAMQAQRGHKVKPSQAGWDAALDETGPGTRQVLDHGPDAEDMERERIAGDMDREAARLGDDR